MYLLNLHSMSCADRLCFDFVDIPVLCVLNRNPACCVMSCFVMVVGFLFVCYFVCVCVFFVCHILVKPPFFFSLAVFGSN